MHFNLSNSQEVVAELGQRLRAQRLLQNLQQDELAGRAGISERALRNIERSGRATLDNFVRVVMALGLVEEMDGIFALKLKSIKAMEAASIKRQRASRATE
jgi:transcriptional regulator with XRE-family HTH domain